MNTKFKDYAMKFLLPMVLVLMLLLLLSLPLENADLTSGIAMLALITSVFGLVLGRR